jgi:hypothetical protein
MTKINKIVTSQVEGRETSDRNEPNTYSYNENGVIIRHDENSVGARVLGPGVFYGANGDGADQSGFDTIKLIPDFDLNTDQYLIIDPTDGVPGHIHIRAGGLIDDSNAVLILGGEKNNVRVDDDSRSVEINTKPPLILITQENLSVENGTILTASLDERITYDYVIVVDGVECSISFINLNQPEQGLVQYMASTGTSERTSSTVSCTQKHSC